jgi:hypothetical protein
MIINRDLGEQPIAGIMASAGLKAQDLVAASTEQITFKMVSRAVKGRRLTLNVQTKMLNAVNKAAKKAYKLSDIFNYKGT